MHMYDACAPVDLNTVSKNGLVWLLSTSRHPSLSALHLLSQDIPIVQVLRDELKLSNDTE